jgi:type I restriction enzyme S subunit
MTVSIGWADVRLDQVAEVRLGRQRSPDKAHGDNLVPYLRAANVRWTGLDLSDVKLMQFSRQEVGTFQLERDDILVVEASGSQGEVGKSALWRGELPLVCFQNTLLRVRSLGADPAFLRWQLHRDALFGGLGGASKGVGIYHIGAARLSNWTISLPPLNEQRRIVAKLDAIFEQTRAAKARIERLPALLEKLKRSILAAAFRGDLTSSWRSANEHEPNAAVGIERLRGRCKALDANAPLRLVGPAETETVDRSLPDGWAWARLGELGHDPLAAVQTGPFGAQLHSDEFVDEGVPVIAVGNLTGTGFTKNGIYFVTPEKAQQLNRYNVQAGDVLFARSGATLGKVCVAPSDVADWRMTGHILRLRLKTSVLLPDIAVFALHGAEAVTKQVRAGIRGMTRPGYNTALLEGIWVPVPPIREQVEIVRQIHEAFEKLERLEAAIMQCESRLVSFERSALAKAFRGELVHQDPNDEPAAALLDRIRAAHAAEPTAPRRGRTAPRSAPAPAAATPTNGHATAQREDPLDLVIAAFQQGEARLGAATIAHATGLDAAAVKRALATLVDCGQVRARGTTYEWAT